ncbi:TetR/AcrR family transcriptional regulator [Pseudomonas sp. MAC6]|uniref:TetR/AcrR family transcriptional regulator n=1 Tax=Pseudomonas sp. MAC6 TaxID=3401633 RepID=UPI003BF4EE9D
MSGLRERQKEQRREAILVAAMGLFDLNGYTTTTVEQIAAKAGVSAPTIFNYFGTKQEILFALVDRADRIGMADAWTKLDRFDNAVDALCAFFSIVVTNELTALPLSIWRELMSATFNTSASKELIAVNKRLIKDIADILREMQRRTMLKPSFDAELVAEILTDYATQVFARLVQADDPDFEAEEAYVRRGVEIMVSGLRF